MSDDLRIHLPLMVRHVDYILQGVVYEIYLRSLGGNLQTTFKSFTFDCHIVYCKFERKQRRKT